MRRGPDLSGAPSSISAFLCCVAIIANFADVARSITLVHEAQKVKFNEIALVDLTARLPSTRQLVSRRF
jgi:hypothetical protein